MRSSSACSIEKVVVLDALTYAGHLVNLDGVADDRRFEFVKGDICDRSTVAAVLVDYAIDSIFHLAAESHVDRSIESADAFVQTNVMGSFTLLDAARRAWEGRATSTRYVHVSTDEVFGALGSTGYFTEASPYAPNSPYAASKASSDLLTRAYVKTYGLPAIITNCCNNYGPYQLPEKLIPLIITNATLGRPLPVYGEGKQIREWLHVEDHCAGLWAVMTSGRVGETYNFGSGEELSNLELVGRLADAVDHELRRPAATSRGLVRFVPDRKGHDFRYAIDSSKARMQLGWEPTRRLHASLPDVVRWYAANTAWCEAVSTEEHQRFQAQHLKSKALP
jgi:dTDP-glucose 4,6-dehydratase